VVAFKQDKDLAGALQIIAPAASSIVATEFHAAAGVHPAGVSSAPERVAAAAEHSGIAVTVEADPVKAISFADAEPDLPVVVSGSFHLLAAIARIASGPLP
jgi:dihydrofolate synthase/folylpolyglutamate synthase